MAWGRSITRSRAANATRVQFQGPQAASQVAELGVGHQGPDGHFNNPEIPIAGGVEVISSRSLVNDRSICPNPAFPDKEIQERE